MSENLKKLVGVVILAALVVVGVSTTRDIQSLSFERNSVSSAVSGQPISLPTAPTVDKTSAVQLKIEAQVEIISEISAEIQAIMQELQALEPPQPPGDDATEQEIEKYYEELAKYLEQVVSLNRQFDQAQKKLAKAQIGLAKLQNSELPQAQQEDAKALQEWAEESQEALEKQAEAISSSKDRRDLTTKAAIETVELRREDTDAFADCVTKRIGRIRLESHTRNAISGCLQEAPN